ncbi:hypothetical protein C8J56DRAFT_886270 [Mycena floridula]|nr:hypothetical protein C8J56DRAFT_886270 [Mycena floridula]
MAKAPKPKVILLSLHCSCILLILFQKVVRAQTESDYGDDAEIFNSNFNDNFAATTVAPAAPPAPPTAPAPDPAPGALAYALRNIVTPTKTASDGIKTALQNRRTLRSVQDTSDVTPTRSRRAASQQAHRPLESAAPGPSRRWSLSRIPSRLASPCHDLDRLDARHGSRGRTPDHHRSGPLLQPYSYDSARTEWNPYMGPAPGSSPYPPPRNIHYAAAPIMSNAYVDKDGFYRNTEPDPRFFVPPPKEANPYGQPPIHVPFVASAPNPRPVYAEPGHSSHLAPHTSGVPDVLPVSAEHSSQAPLDDGSDEDEDDEDDEDTKENREPRRRGRTTNAAKAGLEASLKKMDELAASCAKEHGFSPDMLRRKWLPHTHGPTPWNDAQTMLKDEDMRIQWISNYVPGTENITKAQTSDGYTNIARAYGKGTGEYLRLLVEEKSLDKPQSRQSRQRTFRDGFSTLTRTAEHLHTMVGMNVLMFAVGDSVEEDHSSSMYYSSPRLSRFVEQFFIASPEDMLSYMKGSLFNTVAFEHLVAKLRLFLAEHDASGLPGPSVTKSVSASKSSSSATDSVASRAAAGSKKRDKSIETQIRQKLRHQADGAGVPWSATILPWLEMIDKNRAHGVQIINYPHNVPLPGKISDSRTTANASKGGLAHAMVKDEKTRMNNQLDDPDYPLEFVKLSPDEAEGLRNGTVPYIIYAPPPQDSAFTRAERLFHSKERPNDFLGPDRLPRDQVPTVKTSTSRTRSKSTKTAKAPPKRRGRGRRSSRMNDDTLVEAIDDALDDEEEFDGSEDERAEAEAVREEPIVTRAQSARVKLESEQVNGGGNSSNSSSGKRRREPSALDVSGPSAKRLREASEYVALEPFGAPIPSDIPSAMSSDPDSRPWATPAPDSILPPVQSPAVQSQWSYPYGAAPNGYLSQYPDPSFGGQYQAPQSQGYAPPVPYNLHHASQYVQQSSQYPQQPSGPAFGHQQGSGGLVHQHQHLGQPQYYGQPANAPPYGHLAGSSQHQHSSHVAQYPQPPFGPGAPHSIPVYQQPQQFQASHHQQQGFNAAPGENASQTKAADSTPGGS